MRENLYVIGVDGGGTKTVAALADLKGKILKLGKSGSSSPRNVGIKESMANVAQAIEEVLAGIKGKKILSTFLGLPTMEEEFKFKKSVIRKELLKHKEISPIFKGKLVIGSDQLAGFRSGTDEKDGVVLIAGTGCVSHGWRKNKEVKVDGWGYLTEMGSAFWVGQKGLQAIWKEMDGRGQKTLITKLVFEKLKIKNWENLIKKIYSKNPIEIIPSFSILVDEASKRGDKVAKNILIGAAKELALSVQTVIKKLTPPFLWQRAGFPLVLVGSLFKSKIILNEVKKELKKFAPKVQFILPKSEPVIGAIKLAIEEMNLMLARKMEMAIKGGKVIISPTDTVYGLIANAQNKQAVKKIFGIKRRSGQKPLPIFVRDLKMAKELAFINQKQEKFLREAWPGKITVILKTKPKAQRLFKFGIISSEKKIGLRIPKYKLINLLLNKLNFPLTGTSANISGQPASTKIKEVLKQFAPFRDKSLTGFENQKYQSDLIIDLGDLPKSKPSIVIDLIQFPPKILRE
jgi:tRNA threonylcarbamoyl adenosine modification protein (Sua5/YciO/YrdC/YwlC family)